jgi:L-asparaginase / beta-aspartyl-peptidase
MAALTRLAIVALLLLPALAPADPPETAVKAVLVVHGGAGLDAKRTPANEQQYRTDIENALRAGYEAMYKPRGTALDGVMAAINVLEDSGRFNCGKGACYNREGKHELNASIMEGKTKKAGAVAGLVRVKNPITAARLVMEKSDHVFLIGDGAERFLRSQGTPDTNPLYFWTELQWTRLLEAQARAKKRAPDAGADAGADADAPEEHFGTVGAVALDKDGNLAAGTSTGGIMNKLPGRVGDSPIIGAGTYADNGTCAISCTGHGEFYIRHVVAHDLAARMRYKKVSVSEATDEVFRALPKMPGGIGGLIALDRQGTAVMQFDTVGMPRGYATADGKFHVKIYPDK